MYRVLLLLISILRCFSCSNDNLTESVVIENVNEVKETQHAVCRIATEETVTNAEATITRVLTGVCSSRALEDGFRSLENAVNEKLFQIRQLLEIALNKNLSSKEERVIEKEFESGHYISEKTLEKSPRYQEIAQLNGTVQQILTKNGTLKVFYYYWEVNNFLEKLENWETGRYERSQTFYLSPESYAMFLKVTPKYFPDGTVFISLGITRGIHDYSLKWPFPLKSRIEILDHAPEIWREDKKSRIWDPWLICSDFFWGKPPAVGPADNPECVGLSVNRKLLLDNHDSKYLWNGNLFIKLTVRQ